MPRRRNSGSARTIASIAASPITIAAAISTPTAKSSIHNFKCSSMIISFAHTGPLAIPYQPQQDRYRHRLDAHLTVDRADLESRSPLGGHAPIGFEQAYGRIVDVRRLRRHAVQLDDFELPALKRLHRRCADVEAPEVESEVRPAHLLDRALERWRPQPNAI